MENSDENIENNYELDWSKPIQFRNGELLTLMNVLDPTKPCQFGPEHIYVIHRDSIEESMASIWWVKKDGKSSWGPEFDVINRKEP